jgi:hypothetical protein
METRRENKVGKWIAGLVGAVITGSLVWYLTTIVLPKWFADDPPPPPAKQVRVECLPNPATIAPGGLSEITVRVTRGGEPLEGAAVSMSVGGGQFSSGTATTSGQTYSGGVFRTTWRAPSPSAAGYVFPAEVDLKGIRTSEGELEGHFRTDCEVLVSQ